MHYKTLKLITILAFVLGLILSIIIYYGIGSLAIDNATTFSFNDAASTAGLAPALIGVFIGVVALYAYIKIEGGEFKKERAITSSLNKIHNTTDLWISAVALSIRKGGDFSMLKPVLKSEFDSFVSAMNSSEVVHLLQHVHGSNSEEQKYTHVYCQIISSARSIIDSSEDPAKGSNIRELLQAMKEMRSDISFITKTDIEAYVKVDGTALQIKNNSFDTVLDEIMKKSNTPTWS